MKFDKIKILPFLLVMLFFSGQDLLASSGEEGVDLQSVMQVMIGVTAFLIAFIMWLVLVYSEKNDTEGNLFLAPFRSFLQFINNSTPITEEHKILMDHDYDGIKELDNKIPPWFSFMFYGTIIFSIIYMVNFHIIGTGNIMEEEYSEEVRLAQVQKNILTRSGALIDENSVAFSDDPVSLSNGKDIYMKNCLACHGANGEGTVGPNFTDDYWIHGGSIKDIFTTIKYGVPSKGMISWQTQLNPTQMQEVGSFIMTMRGTNPPNPKKAEGELYKPEAEKEKENEQI